MKNKHLVFIFLLTLVAGLLARRLPWRMSEIFQTDLIEVDTSVLQSISIRRLNAPELLLERTDAGWVADQYGRPVQVPQTEAEAMLQVLSHVQTLRIVKTKRPDTLGLNDAISVQVHGSDDRNEMFYIGKQTVENGAPATYIELKNHEGIYLVKNHLRDVFDKTAEHFRTRTAVRFVPQSISGITFFWQKQDSVAFWNRNDTTALWEYGTLTRPDDSVQQWLHLLTRLNGGPFADHFDDSRARETLVSTLSLKDRSDSTPLELRFYYFAPPEIPDDPSDLRTGGEGFSDWVLQSSLNPHNYFCINDTALLRRILYGLSR